MPEEAPTPPEPELILERRCRHPWTWTFTSRAHRTFVLTRLESKVNSLGRRDKPAFNSPNPDASATRLTSVVETDVTTPGAEKRRRGVPEIRRAAIQALIHEHKKEQPPCVTPVEATDTWCETAHCKPIRVEDGMGTRTVEEAPTDAVRETAEERETGETPSSFFTKTLVEKPQKTEVSSILRDALEDTPARKTPRSCEKTHRRSRS